MFSLIATLFYRFSSEEGVDYNVLIHFFTSMIVQSLNLCGTLDEHHSHNLLQVILAGLKNGVYKEYRSSIVVIFACIVPRLRFSGKVIGKILKSLDNLEEKDVETLSMLALIFRCQNERVSHISVLKSFLSHREVIFDQVTS